MSSPLSVSFLNGNQVACIQRSEWPGTANGDLAAEFAVLMKLQAYIAAHSPNLSLKHMVLRRSMHAPHGASTFDGAVSPVQGPWIVSRPSALMLPGLPAAPGSCPRFTPAGDQLLTHTGILTPPQAHYVKWRNYDLLCTQLRRAHAAHTAEYVRMNSLSTRPRITVSVARYDPTLNKYIYTHSYHVFCYNNSARQGLETYTWVDMTANWSPYIAPQAVTEAFTQRYCGVVDAEGKNQYIQ